MSRTSRKVSEKRKARGDEICKVALSLFSQRGYHTTTLKDIAETLNMTHPALYYYYTSKENLLFDAIKGSLGNLISDIGNNLALSAEEKHAQRLAIIMKTQILNQLENKGVMPLIDSVLFGQLSHQQLFEEDNREVLRVMQRNLTDVYKNEIVAGTNAGEFKVSEPNMVSFCILGAVSSVVYWYNENKGYDKKSVADKVSLFLSKICY